jgi:hypothetical protein
MSVDFNSQRKQHPRKTWVYSRWPGALPIAFSIHIPRETNNKAFWCALGYSYMWWPTLWCENVSGLETACSVTQYRGPKRRSLPLFEHIRGLLAICDQRLTMYDIQGKVHLWVQVKSASLCVTATENWNCPVTSGWSLTYRILKLFV